MESIYLTIVLAPLIAAAVAGLGGGLLIAGVLGIVKFMSVGTKASQPA